MVWVGLRIKEKDLGIIVVFRLNKSMWVIYLFKNKERIDREREGRKEGDREGRGLGEVFL